MTRTLVLVEGKASEEAKVHTNQLCILTSFAAISTETVTKEPEAYPATLCDFR